MYGQKSRPGIRNEWLHVYGRPKRERERESGCVGIAKKKSEAYTPHTLGTVLAHGQDTRVEYPSRVSRQGTVRKTSASRAFL